MIEGTYLEETFQIDKGVVTGSDHVAELLETLSTEQPPEPSQGDSDLVLFNMLAETLQGVDLVEYTPMKITKSIVY